MDSRIRIFLLSGILPGLILLVLSGCASRMPSESDSR